MIQFIYHLSSPQLRTPLFQALFLPAASQPLFEQLLALLVYPLQQALPNRNNEPWTVDQVYYHLFREDVPPWTLEFKFLDGEKDLVGPSPKQEIDELQRQRCQIIAAIKAIEDVLAPSKLVLNDCDTDTCTVFAGLEGIKAEYSRVQRDLEKRLEAAKTTHAERLSRGQDHHMSYGACTVDSDRLSKPAKKPAYKSRIG